MDGWADGKRVMGLGSFNGIELALVGWWKFIGWVDGRTDIILLCHCVL
jgi:hypothetical protein